MSSVPFRRLIRTVGFRIVLWHSVTFVVGAVLIFTAAYYLLRHSVDQQAKEAIEFRLNQFSFEYERGGAEAVIALCKLRRGRAQRAFFVRLADAENVTTFLRDREDWAEFKPADLTNRPVPHKSLLDRPLQSGGYRAADWVNAHER
jgi:hypothetical protein